MKLAKLYITVSVTANKKVLNCVRDVIVFPESFGVTYRVLDGGSGISHSGGCASYVRNRIFQLTRCIIGIKK